MSERTSKSFIPVEGISSKIHVIRGKKVLFDVVLADLYGIETKRLNEQVKRNIERFPKDFMFQLTREEFENLKSQFATSSWGGRRNYPVSLITRNLSGSTTLIFLLSKATMPSFSNSFRNLITLSTEMDAKSAISCRER
jgi:hypothetical protein